MWWCVWGGLTSLQYKHRWLPNPHYLWASKNNNILNVYMSHLSAPHHHPTPNPSRSARTPTFRADPFWTQGIFHCNKWFCNRTLSKDFSNDHLGQSAAQTGPWQGLDCDGGGAQPSEPEEEEIIDAQSEKPHFTINPSTAILGCLFSALWGKEPYRISKEFPGNTTDTSPIYTHTKSREHTLGLAFQVPVQRQNINFNSQKHQFTQNSLLKR